MSKSIKYLNLNNRDRYHCLQQSKFIGFSPTISRLSRYFKRGLLAFCLLHVQIPLMLLNPRPAWADGDICATPGKDGVVNVSNVVNTYFVGGAPGEIANPGQKSILLPASNADGASTEITPGDMLMIIQMQDATIDPDNDATYGSGNAANDGSGAVSIGNSGVYEFVRATNTVPVTGGLLQFEAGGVGEGLQNRYVNSAATATQGQRAFQVVRVPQYATLTLQSNLAVPDWDGTSGGILAIDVAGAIDLNGFTIDGTATGFRGGYALSGNSGINIADYVVAASDTPSTNLAGGKGEGIAGTPRFTWDGNNANDLGSDRLPGGDAGRGAPGNAGGGGNDHNSGGGGGGNGGKGGTGGIGWEGAGFRPPANNTNNTPGGRGGAIPTAPTISRLIMGGGGGGGDANNETNGVRGGQGGGIVLIRAGEFIGSGTIEVNGSDGEQGEFNNAPDGAGGGGAGGTVALIAESGNLAGITVEAVGGDGGDTVNDNNNEHGPGGAGAGGVIISHSPGGQVSSFTVTGGDGGRADDGNGIPHGTDSGDGGIATLAIPTDIPPILSGSQCFPALTVTKTEANPGEAGERFAPNTANYSITVTNTGNGSATGVKIKDTLPSGFTYSSGATATLSSGATGSATPNNTGTAAVPVFGDYLIPSGESVTINFEAGIPANTPLGVYQNPASTSYLDPSRTTTGRRITPMQGADPDDNVTYEGGVNAGQAVPGTNYIATSSGGENVHISSTDPVSPLAGKVIINEVLFRQTGDSASENDEFIELYNAGDAAVDLTDWQLIDGNLLTGDTDGNSGSINGSNGSFVFPNGIILNPGEYAVVWLGTDTGTASKNAPNAAHQFYLDQIRRLNNQGDDVWLYDANTRIVDYVAYGSGSAINTPPDPAFGLWNNAAQSSLRNVSKGQSISLTPNGQDGNDSRCWEATTSKDADVRCTTYLFTRTTDSVSSRITSVGDNNNGPQLSLVKRITAIIPNREGVNFNTFIEDGIADNEDNHPRWPSDRNTYLRGQIGGLKVQPGDEIEYTVYFLSNGGTPATAVKLCDVIPDSTTLVKDTYGVELGIGLGLSNSSLPIVPNIQLSNLLNDDQGDFYAPGTTPPLFCQKNDPQAPNNLIPVNAANNNAGAIVVELDSFLPHATDSGTPTNSYGFIRFRAQVE